MKNYFSDSEIDNILNEVEEELNNSLAKSQALSKAFPGAEEGSEQPEAAPASPAPAAAASPDMAAPAASPDMAAPASPDMGAPAEDAGAAPEMGQEGQPGEEALEDGSISDEELQQIYGSMDPQELERHYMILRGLLRNQYAGQEGQEAPAQAAAPEQSAAPEMDQSMGKSESDVLLKQENEDMKKSLEAALKAIEMMARPSRKAVTEEFQILGKSELDIKGSSAKKDYSNLSKSELTPMLNAKVREPNLSKSDRDAINSFILNNHGKEKVLEILGRN